MAFAYTQVVYCIYYETEAMRATLYAWLRVSTTVYPYICNKPCQIESRLVVLCTHVPFNYNIT